MLIRIQEEHISVVLVSDFDIAMLRKGVVSEARTNYEASGSSVRSAGDVVKTTADQC